MAVNEEPQTNETVACWENKHTASHNILSDKNNISDFCTLVTKKFKCGQYLFVFHHYKVIFLSKLLL